MAVKIVDKELALKLKELGFDMEVYDCYFMSSTLSTTPSSGIPRTNHNRIGMTISAPTYDEVLHWLRDKHELYGCVFRNKAKRNTLKHIATLKKSDDCADSDGLIYEAHNSYEDGQLAIINKAIEILEEQLKTKEHESKCN